MTFQVTVTSGGKPVPFAIVVANDQASGKSFARGTDGEGYADVALYNVPNGTPMTLTVTAPGYQNAIRYPVTTASNQVMPIDLVPFKKPFQSAPRFWKGQMCGLRIPGLPPVAGGASDASLFLSWFYDRYSVEDRATIRAAMRARGYTHWLLSWPDSRAQGATPQTFRDLCLELIRDGFYPCVMLSSKDFDAPDVHWITADWTVLLPSLVGVVPMFCVGWELSLWLSPTQVQLLNDWLAAYVLPKEPRTLLYDHFQEGYMSFQQDGGTIADFWRKQVGKLTGVLAQKRLRDNDAEFLDWLHDCLTRMAGNFNMPSDSGFGHPFDFVGLELTAMAQFNGTCSEAEGDRIGRLAINAPKEAGPAGAVGVMGSGNGA